MNLTESESYVLAGILPTHAVRMETARLRNLKESNFSTSNFKVIWRYLSAYYDEHMNVIPRWVLSNNLERDGHSDAKRVELLDTYDILSKHTVLDHEFKAGIDILKEDEVSRRTEELIVSAREILRGEYYDPEEDQIIRGQDKARAFLSEGLQSLEVEDAEYAPEGSVKDDVEKMYLAYLQKEENPEQAGGIHYGIPELDDYTGGVRAGELVLVAGFTGSGKSHMVTSLAWNAMRAGKNVLMFTTETTREEMEIRIIARHSRLPKFKNPDGLNAHEILEGKLKGRDREVFRDVLTDFKDDNPGELYMVQMPVNGFVDYVHAKASEYNRKAPIDLVIIDSINLLRTMRRYPSKREMLEDLLQDFKRFASAFDNGRGVAVVSPWQMSRNAWQEAKEAGGIYTLASLADTSEAEKCLTLDGRVLTMQGFKEIKDVHPGEFIVDSDGLAQEVLEEHDNGILPIYLVTTNDGAEVKCTPQHIWTVKINGKFVNRTAQQLMEDGGEYEIPVLSKQPDFHAPGLVPGKIFNPTILGWMLKAGESTEEELVVIPQYTHTLTTHLPFPTYVLRTEDSSKFVYEVDELRDYLRPELFEDIQQSGVMTGDPTQFRIPVRYLNASHHVREALVRAFMDDSQKNLHQAKVSYEDISMLPFDHPGIGGALKYLVASLGWPLGPVPRKIVSVVDTGTSEPTKCITVSHPNGLFVTDGFVLTHNSSSQIITLFKKDDGQLNIQLIKNRGGMEMSAVSYPYDYRNSFIGTSGDSPTASKPKNAKANITMDVISMMGD